MKLSQSFAPVARPDARILILGSMPGVASLDAVQYYAFPRNAFWRIMGELFAAGPELDYPLRLERLKENQIALWDVIGTCHRPGSLDSAISNDGMITNDFNQFFIQHKEIRQVFFNGQKAADLFRKKVMPDIIGNFNYTALPSTSPANAAKTYAAKLAAWAVIRN
ncbi:MAG: DNA-deoxyinosine glycosylase [Xanthomonadales bacterium]|nr:DNA-deoxyinosine glycosylase [Xanthomonadales bacterium]